MSTTIEHWRAAIGRVSGGRRGTSTSSSSRAGLRQQGSTWCLSIAILLAMLLASPLLLSGWSLLTAPCNSSSSLKSIAYQLQSGSCVTTVYTTVKTSLVTPPAPPWAYGQRSGVLQHISNKQRNQIARAINGNRDAKGIRLAHWNPGSAHLGNKMTQLELAVADHKPHLLGISEANFKSGHDLQDVQLEDYELLLSKTFNNEDLQVSRVVCYMHNSLVGGIREDLMSENFSSIWVEIGLP